MGTVPEGCWGPPSTRRPPPERSCGCGRFPAELRHIQAFPARPGCPGDTPGVPRGPGTRLSPLWAAGMEKAGAAPSSGAAAEPLPEPRGHIGTRPPQRRLQGQTEGRQSRELHPSPSPREAEGPGDPGGGPRAPLSPWERAECWPRRNEAIAERCWVTGQGGHGGGGDVSPGQAHPAGMALGWRWDGGSSPPCPRRAAALHPPGLGGQIRAGCVEINPSLPSTAVSLLCFPFPVPSAAGGRNRGHPLGRNLVALSHNVP